MAGFVRQQFRIHQPLVWLDQLEALVARELAPSPRKIRTTLRISAIVTIAIGLDAICHVNGQLGAVVVWLLAGAGPTMSIRKALAWQIAVMLALITSVVMARAFAETPWLMLPFVFAWISFSTYAGTTRKLGAGLLVIQIVCLITFYGVVFAHQEIGWNAAASFDGNSVGISAGRMGRSSRRNRRRKGVRSRSSGSSRVGGSKSSDRGAKGLRKLAVFRHATSAISQRTSPLLWDINSLDPQASQGFWWCPNY